MLSKIKGYIAKKFPIIGRPKRLFLAYISKHTKIKKSYSQIGEDEIALKILGEGGINNPIFYVDIGANHPSRLSNTYRMYREGSSGITIEPNEELAQLHRLIRPRDTQLAIGCGRASQIKKFYYSKVPVLSSFNQCEVEQVWQIGYLPIFTLDKICKDLEIKSIDFLSIDVEGLDLDVLEGGIEILKNTYLVCIEANTNESESKICNFMKQNNFDFILKNKWNLFFVNKI